MSSDDLAESTPRSPGIRRIHLRWWQWLALYFVVVIGIISGLYAVKFISGDTFTIEQWAAAGGWVGGFGAVAAVVVALYQSQIAVKNADQARLDAEALLSKELEAHRRVRQIEAVLPIWPAIATMHRWYRDEYKPKILTAYKALNSSQSPRYSEGLTLFTTLKREWSELATDIDLRFEPALLLTTQPDVAKALAKIHSWFRDLDDEMKTTFHHVRQLTEPDTRETDRIVRAFRQARTDLLQLMRTHFADGPPISFRRRDDH